jgi:hypothetical protein
MDMNDYVYQDLMEELRERRVDAIKMNDRISQLLGDTEQLRKERDELRQQVENIKNGFEGCCYACEPVGLLNKQLLKERDEARQLACEFCVMDGSGYSSSYRAKEEAIARSWDCFKEETP